MTAPFSLSSLSDSTLLTARSMGALGSAGFSVTDHVGPDDTADYFSFTLSSQQLVNLRLSNVSNYYYEEIVLFDASGNRIAGNNIGGLDNTGLKSLLQAGTYYVRVDNYYYGGGTTADTYTLTGALLTSPDGAAGHSLASPTALGALSTTLKSVSDWVGLGAGVDVYSFTLASSQTVNLRLTPSGTILRSSFSLRLEDANGAQISQGSGGFEQNLSAQLAAGTYYVVLSDQSNSVVGETYTLNAWTGLPAFGTSATDRAGGFAAPLAIGALSTAKTYSDWVGSTDQEDWYSFSLASPSIVSARLTVAQYANTYVTIYAADGSTYYDSRYADSSSAGVAVASLAAGNYYIKVSGDGDGTGYSLTASASALLNTVGNTLATATAFGTLSSTAIARTDWTGILSGSSSNTVDYFSFKLAATGYATLTLNGVGDPNTYLTLYDSAGNQITSAYVGDSDTITLHPALAAGSYYASVSNSSGGTRYTLSASTTAIATGTAGHTIASATALGALGTTPVSKTDWIGLDGSQDVYSFTLAAPSRVRLQTSLGRDTASLYLLDNNGNVINSQSFDINGSVLSNILGAGTYYVALANSTAGNSNYTLTASAVGVDGAAKHTLATATALPGGISATVRSLSDWVGSASPYDYYSFTLASAQTVNFQIASQIGTNVYWNNGTIYADILDANGNTVFTSASASGFDASILTYDLTAGTYYVRLNGQSAADAPYALNWWTGKPTIGAATVADAVGATILTAKDLGTLGSTALTVTDYIGQASGKPNDPEDMFKFTVSGLTSVQLKLDLDAYATFNVYDAYGNLIASPYHNPVSAGANSVPSLMLDSGVYYVDIKPYYTDQSGGYALTITGSAVTDTIGHTLATATTLGTTGGTLATRSDTIAANGPRASDVYTFAVGTQTSVSIELSGVSANATVTLYDAYGTNIASSYFSTTGGQLLGASIGAGNYYVRVQSQGNPTSYSLSLATSTALVDHIASSYPDTLANAQAVTLTGGKATIASQWVGAASNDHYYSFTLTAASIVDVATAGGTPYEALLDANGAVIKSDSDGHMRAILAAGTYYVRTNSTTVAGSKYDLSISAAALAQGTAGNTPAAATTITPSATAVALTDYAGGLAGADYYKFTLTATQTVNFRVGGVSQTANYDLATLSGGFGTTALSSGSSYASPGTDGVVSVTLAAGTYLFWVAGSVWTPYSLTYSTGAPTVGVATTDNAGADSAHAKAIGTLTSTIRTDADWIGAADTDDYYKFTVSALSNVTLTATGPGAALILYASDGSQLASDSNANGYQPSLTQALAAGTYYLDVQTVGYDGGYSLASVARTLPDATGKTSASATSLGTVGATAVTKSDWIGAAAPNDYYKLVLAATSTLNVDVAATTQVGASAYSYLEILDSSLNSLGGDSNYLGADGDGLHTATVLAAGTYYIHLNSTASQGVAYTVSAAATAIVDGTAGNIAASSQSLGTLASTPVTVRDWIGTGAAGADYFTFTLSKIQTVLLKINAPFDFYANLQLLDASLNQITAASGYTGSIVDVDTYATLGPGTYYARITSNSGIGAYSLSASAVTPPDAGAGKSLGTATALNLTTLAATPRTDWVGAAGGSDFYSFTLSASTYVTFAASGVSNSGLNLQLLDSSGNQLRSSGATSGYAPAIVDGALGAGTYYLEVHDDTDTSYTLSYAAGAPAFGTSTATAIAGPSIALAKDLGTLGTTAVRVSEYLDGSLDEYYKFSIASTSTVSLTMPHEGYYGSLTLLGAGGAQLATDSYDVGPAAITATLQAGTYYVRTGGYAGGYVLTATAATATPAGNRTIADALGLGTDPGPITRSATIDKLAKDGWVYYRLVLTNPTAMDFSLTGLNGDANLHLLDANGVEIDGQYASQSDPLFEHRMLAPGAYVVAVESRIADPLNYTLSINPQSITVSNVAVVEGDTGTKTALFTVTLATANSTLPVSVNYKTIDGTALAGSDYVAAAGTLTFAPGQTSATIAVTVNADAIVEGNETFSLQLSNPVGATFAAGATTLTGTGTITNDDVAIASIGNVSLLEGDSGSAIMVFTVQLTKASATPITFAYATSDGTAIAGSDYTAASGTLTIAAGQTSGTISVAVTGDTAVEPDETLSLALSSPIGASFAGGASSLAATGTITNNDVSASIAGVTLVEGNSGTTNAVFTVQLTGPALAPVTIAYATSDGTAVAGTDYVASTGTLTIAAGQSSGTISVAVNGDALVEGDETFTLTLSSPTGATFTGGGSTATATGTITNDDIAIATIGNVSIVEGNSGTSNAVFAVTLSNASATPITFAYATSDGTATAGSDYTAASGTLTIAAGATTGTISVAVAGDTVLENDETFGLRLSSPAGASFAGGATTLAATGTIVNDDLPIVTINNVTMAEGNSGTSNAIFTVTLSNASTSPVTIAYKTVDGTARAAGSDYVAASGTLTIAAGATSGTIAVAVNGDAFVEPTETFTLALSSPTGAGFAGGASTISGTATITNDDVAIATISNANVTEGDSGTTNAVFTVFLSTYSVSPITFAYATSNGTATAGSDYTATSGTLTIAPGVKAATISVAVAGDTAVEGNETFNLTLSSPNGASFTGNVASIVGVGTIVDNDRATVSIANVSVTEGNSGTATALFTVNLSAAATTAVTVAYATTDGTATAGTDYVATQGTLTIAAGTTSGTISVAVVGDTLVEGNETFGLTLSSPTGAGFAGGATSISAAGTITNDDIAIATIGNVSIVEGNSGTSNAVFTVALSNASATPVTIAYATSDGTAAAGSDYTAATGTLTIAAGATTGTISVAVSGDALVEGNETFGLTLSSPSGASFGSITTIVATGTITNDDVAVATIGNVSIVEGNSGTSNAVFTVTLNNASATPITFAYATSNGTATAGSDYTATTGTLTIAAGATSGTISVAVAGDTAPESSETFGLTLSSPTGASFAGGATTLAAIGTIIDDDLPIATVNNVTMAEGNSGTSNAVFTVTLSAPATTPVTIAYKTVDGTARSAGSDYVATSGTLTIAAGATSGTIAVAVSGDPFVEPTETFSLVLSSPTGASFTGGAATVTATGTIQNDDTAIATVNNVNILEGDSGTTNAVFTVSLSTYSTTPITIAYATSNGTALAGSDYTATSGTLTFAPGVKAVTLSVPIIGDTVPENNEAFNLTLSSPVGASFAGNVTSIVATGTIVDNDVAPPVVTVSDTSVAIGSSIALSSLFTVTLGRGDTVSSYQLRDTNAASTSGTIKLAGVSQAAGSVVTISASALSTTTFAAGTAAGQDTLFIKAVGTTGGPSGWTPVNVTTIGARAPVLATSVSKVVGAGSTLAASSLASVNDNGGTAITEYQFLDLTDDTQSGSFLLGSTVQASGQVIDLMASAVASATFKAGSLNSSDELWVRVSNGSAWSNWSQVTVSAVSTTTANTTNLQKPATSLAA